MYFHNANDILNFNDDLNGQILMVFTLD